MLTKEQSADVFDRIRSFSSADEVEAIFTGSRFALTRFANNTIHQNVEEENSVVSIRTNFGGRTARSTANQFDDDSLRRAVAASENLARVQAPDPDVLPMPTADEAKAAGEGARATRFFEETANIAPSDRAEVVRDIVSVADRHKLTTAGIYSNSESHEGIFNSRGLANWHQQTLAEVSITMLADDSSEEQRARKLLGDAGAESLDAARKDWWVGIRDSEEEHYRSLGYNFETDEEVYRSGFEAALRRECRGRSLDEETDCLKWWYPDIWNSEPFRRGNARGRAYRDRPFAESTAKIGPGSSGG